MNASLLLTAKCTSAPLGKLSNGSGACRNAIEKQHQVDGVLVVLRVAHLSHHPQPVRVVARKNISIEAEGRLELRHDQLGLEPHQIDAIAQHIERTALIHLCTQAIKQRIGGLVAVVLDERRPRLRLRGLHPRHDIGRKESSGAVVVRSVAIGVVPTVGAEVVAQLRLEADLLVEAHGVTFCRLRASSV
jgi:hypothetical protein